jgi:hypothetical protein
VADSRPSPGSARWYEADARRNEAARREILQRAGQRNPSENLAEGIALIRFAARNAGAAVRTKS